MHTTLNYINNQPPTSTQAYSPSRKDFPQKHATVYKQTGKSGEVEKGVDPSFHKYWVGPKGPDDGVIKLSGAVTVD